MESRRWAMLCWIVWSLSSRRRRSHLRRILRWRRRHALKEIGKSSEFIGMRMRMRVLSRRPSIISGIAWPIAGDRAGEWTDGGGACSMKESVSTYGGGRSERQKVAQTIERDRRGPSRVMVWFSWKCRLLSERTIMISSTNFGLTMDGARLVMGIRDGLDHCLWRRFLANKLLISKRKYTKRFGPEQYLCSCY